MTDPDNPHDTEPGTPPQPPSGGAPTGDPGRPASGAERAQAPAGKPGADVKSAPAAGTTPKPSPKPPPGPSPAELALRAAVPSIPLDRLRERFPDLAEGAVFFAGTPIVTVPPARVVEVCHFLKHDVAAACTYLSNLHGSHDPARERPLEVVYNLYSVRFGHAIMLKVQLAETEEAPSVTGVWKTADWHEREAWDMFGIRFANHPNLRRILLPDDWTGHPLRKEYPLEGKEGDHKVYRRE